MSEIDDDERLVAATEEISLETAREAVDRLAESDEDWADLQWMVADRLHDRYRDEKNRADLIEAVDRGRSAVAALTRHGDAPSWLLADLALIIFDAVLDSGERDLDECIGLLERAIDEAGGPDDEDADRAIYRARLARVLMSRSEVSTDDYLRAISLWELASQCRELGPDARAQVLTDVSAALSTPDANPDQLRRAVEYGRRGLAENSDDSIVAADVRIQLAYALQSLHGADPDGNLLDEAIAMSRDALELLGPGHPDHPGYNADLVNIIRQRGRETGDTELLAEGLRLIREDAVARTDDDHPDRHLILEAAAAIAAELGWWKDDEGLVRDSIALHRRAADLPDVDPHAKSIGLINLASTLRDAADHFADSDLLDEGILVGNKAVSLCALPGQTRAAALSATSNLLRDRHVAKRVAGGLSADLRAAIAYAEESLALTPTEARLHAVRQTNLAVVLSDRYTDCATLVDLDKAISLYRDALRAPEPESRRIAERQNNLALALRDRFATSYDDVDLSEALKFAEGSVVSTPEASRSWPGYATNFGNALMERFEIHEKSADLDWAIDLFQRALRRVLGRPADESGFATNLGLALASRAQITESISVYGESIVHLQRATDALPDDHPDRAHRLANLAEVYLQRSRLNERGGRTDDAKSDVLSAVEFSRSAVDEAGAHDARQLPALANLAGAMRRLRGLDSEAVALQDVLAVQRRVASLDEVPAIDKFPQTILWARDAAALGDCESDDEAMSAYRKAVDLISDVAWIGLSVSSRKTLLDQMSEALTDAVAFAVKAGHHWDALAWADRVRSVVWRQAVHAKFVIGVGPPESVEKPLRDLFSVSGERSDREQRRSAAHTEFSRTALPELQPSSYAGLRFEGALVLLVPGPEASVAVLLDGQGNSDTVPLPLAAGVGLENQVTLLREALLLLENTDDSVTASADSDVRQRLFDCLDWLWEAVAKPVLDRLWHNGAPPSNRVWWSSLGGFALLPIHAAGRHPRKRTQLSRRHLGRYECLADLVVSAYLPTIFESFGERVSPRTDRALGRLLFVSTDAGTQTLHHAVPEFEAAKNVLQGFNIDLMHDADATVAAVREALPRYSFLHVTAHGAADDEAFASGFRLADGVLTLAHLADSHVRDGELATFLTCDSARGDVTLPNEALHVAAAAMQAGYLNVVAASMPLRDSSAVPIASAIYDAVNTANGPVGNSVVLALNDVVTALRRNPATATDPLAWAPLAYFGWGCDDTVVSR